MQPLHLLVFVICCGAMTSTMSAVIGSNDKDDKCHGLDCPHYTVLNKTADWELRHYEETKWAAINGTGISKEGTNSEMFQKLFEYISGKNAKNVKIPMTAPVLTRVNHGQGPTCDSTFTMHFMIPFNQQDAPIKPTDPHVFIATTPPTDAFVRSFGGFAKEQDFIDNLMVLAQDVAHNAKVEESYFYTAGYDSPYQFLNRHNEVWLVKA